MNRREIAINTLLYSLGFESTKVRNRDALDFQSLKVSNVKEALERAWDKGFEEGVNCPAPEVAIPNG